MILLSVLECERDREHMRGHVEDRPRRRSRHSKKRGMTESSMWDLPRRARGKSSIQGLGCAASIAELDSHCSIGWQTWTSSANTSITLIAKPNVAALTTAAGAESVRWKALLPKRLTRVTLLPSVLGRFEIAAVITEEFVATDAYIPGWAIWAGKYFAGWARDSMVWPTFCASKVFAAYIANSFDIKILRHLQTHRGVISYDLVRQAHNHNDETSTSSQHGHFFGTSVILGIVVSIFKAGRFASGSDETVGGKVDVLRWFTNDSDRCDFISHPDSQECRGRFVCRVFFCSVTIMTGTCEKRPTRLDARCIFPRKLPVAE
jgi:hypothetical protein